MFWSHCCGFAGCARRDKRVLVKEGFVAYSCEFVKFDVNAVENSTPEDLDVFAECASSPTLALLLKDRWFKGDYGRLRRILNLKDHSRLSSFVENCLWERGYEDNYTLGQQMSIRMTTNLIQSGLDFKHHVKDDRETGARGWKCKEFEKSVSTIKSVADITKRYKWNRTYVVLELDNNNIAYLKSLLESHFEGVVTNDLTPNVCVVKNGESPSICVLRRIVPLMKKRLVNVLFVTDTENYLRTHNLFYLYNSVKFYYYCLKNRFVFHYDDYETLYFIHTIVSLEVINGGSLNSFTLEKSPIMHPLELNSRRCNALKRAAVSNKTLCNDMDLKVDFIRGRRITTGTHDPDRFVYVDDESL